MNTQQILNAWREAQGSTEVIREQGLPKSVLHGGALCAYQWNKADLSEIIEADGSQVRFNYGQDGRLLEVFRNGTPNKTFQYDDSDRLTAAVRGKTTFNYQYDTHGHPVKIARGNASPFTYQWQNHRVAKARSNCEHCEFSYDGSGRLIEVRQAVEDQPVTTQFSFDTLGRLDKIHFGEWQHTIEFQWGQRNRPLAIAWNSTPVVSFGYDDQQRLAWSETPMGYRESTLHDAHNAQPCEKSLHHKSSLIWSSKVERDQAFRIVREGTRQYQYDSQSRLSSASDSQHQWRYQYDAADQPILPDGIRFQRDPSGRVRAIQCDNSETVFRHNDGDELQEALQDGERLARCLYDHKGRLVVKQSETFYERYVYGADDNLLAIADRQGRPRIVFIHQPCGPVALVDFRNNETGEMTYLHCDTAGNLVYTSDTNGHLEGPFESDPFGLPLTTPTSVPYLYRGKVWHPELKLYRLGCRWYAPHLRQFMSADTYTGAPDDERLVNPFIKANEQRTARMQILCDWLRQPRCRNVYTYCVNDPVNRFDPNGHWSFGGVLLSLLGVIWTLPNTIFGLAIEITCLLGEVIRWIVYAVSWGNASWQTPGFDVAASGHLNAFALVFKGGWLGSFEGLLGITFGNVFFVHGEYENHSAFQALSDPVSPPAYGGSVTIPKSQALYEHELRHVNQYGWWGPFFHLGLPIWGAYVWDVILNGYQNASMEKDARDHGGF